MLQKAYFVAKIGADTGENEQHFAEILPKICNYPSPVSGLIGAGRAGAAGAAIAFRAITCALLVVRRSIQYYSLRLSMQHDVTVGMRYFTNANVLECSAEVLLQQRAQRHLPW